MKKQLFWITPLALVLASVAFSGKRTNPPVEHQVAWDSPDTEALFYRACADCHSHETTWPWYAHVAPVSWKVIDHVNEGREHFNISVPDMGDSDESAQEVQDDKMPLKDYLRQHPEADLTDEEKTRFIAGLLATFGGELKQGDDDASAADDDSSDESSSEESSSDDKPE